MVADQASASKSARTWPPKEGGYFCGLDSAIGDHGAALGANAVAVYCCIAMHASKENSEAFPSYATIGRLLSLHRNTVMEAVEKLRAIGLIGVQRRKNGANGHTSNVYTLLPRVTPGVVVHDNQGGCPGQHEPDPLDQTQLNQTQEQEPATTAAHPAESNGRNGHGSAAVAFGGLESGKETRQTSNPATPTKPTTPTEPTTGARPEAEAEAEGLVQKLVDRHLGRGIAIHHAAADPALVRVVLVYYDAEKAAGRIKRIPGGLRSMLDDPVSKWGFEQTPNGWRAPPSSQPAASQSPYYLDPRTNERADFDGKYIHFRRLKLHLGMKDWSAPPPTVAQLQEALQEFQRKNREPTFREKMPAVMAAQRIARPGQVYDPTMHGGEPESADDQAADAEVQNVAQATRPPPNPRCDHRSGEQILRDAGLMNGKK